MNFSIPVSKYFELIHPTYLYLQIYPHKGTSNYNNTNISKTIQSVYKAIGKRVSLENKKLSIETKFKISYVVDIRKPSKNNIGTSFYFIVPKCYLNIIIEKIRTIWSKVDLEIVDKIQEFTKETVYYQLNYKKEDALSLQIEKRSSEPLNSILSVMEIMQEEDRVTLVYNFLPKSQFNWNKRYAKVRHRIENKEMILKDTTTFAYKLGLGLTALNYIYDSIKECLNSFNDNSKLKTDTVFSELLITSNIIESNKRLSDSTLRKKDKTVLDAQILIATDSIDKTRRNNISQSVCNSFNILDEEGGNELISKKVKSKEIINIEDYKFKNVGENTFSVDECQNFLQQPGRNLMKSLGIKHVEVEEVKVPPELSQGYISLGEVKCKGEVQESYIEDKYDTGSLPLVAIGSQGAGKTTYMSNYFRFANTKKEGGVIIDFIKNCEMSEEVIGYLPSKDVIILNYTKAEDIQGFAFNEFKFNDDMSTFEKLELTNKQAQQILTFVDSINVEQPLQARMRKYLSASANVVFASGENSLKEVVRCLENYETRAFYINKLEGEEKEFLEDEINDLRALDEYSKPSAKEERYIVGTKNDRIDGIIDRISLLREDFKLKYMFNKGSKGNIDFAEQLEKGKTIIIRMPQDSFKKHAKNVITTFLLSKIWIATEIRGKLNKRPKPTHICIDELFQCKTAMDMLKNDEVLPQTRKFGAKFILSAQYCDQISPIIDTLEGAGSSFMLMSGTSEKDFKRFKNKLEGFEYEDLKDMKQYSSMNVVHYSKGYVGFISQLPKPLNNLKGAVINDRLY